MMSSLVTLAFLATATALPLSNDEGYVKLFDEWKTTYHKQYDTPEIHDHRFQVFVHNIQSIEAHNAQRDKTYTQDINHFADLTPEEFKSRMTGFRIPVGHVSSAEHVFNYTGAPIPDQKNWVTEGKVTAVKNQGQCGSCWAFSTTGAVEAANLIQNGGSNSADANVLSEQQLVSCSYLNHGCNGGVMDLGFQYLKNLGKRGVDTESSYPYLGRHEWFCKAKDHEPSGVQVTGHFDVEQGNEDALLEALGTHGPCSIAIEADQKAFQFYSSGVLTEGCGQQLDHGVLAVGYGTTEDGINYWLVKNSWGPEWGLEGYIKIARGSNLCGVASMASFPTVA